MFLLRTENKRIVSFDALLAQAMSVAAAPAEGLPAALAAQQAIYSAPIFDEIGDDEPFPVMEA